MKNSKILLTALMLFACPLSLAGNAWYWGEVTQIITTGPDGSFVVSLNNTTIINTCAYQRVTFQVSDMGVERTRLAFAMALAAQSSGSNWGVVVDLPASGQTCYASPTSTQGAGVS